MNFKNTLLSTAIAGAIFSTSALAATTNSSASANELAAFDDDTWITVNGEIENIHTDSFVVKTGDNRITVEFDDGDNDADALAFEAGEKVTVSGKVDKDVFSDTALDASSVFVHDHNTTYVSNPDDRVVYDRYIATAVVPENFDDITMIGTVAKVDDDTFELSAADATVKVDVSELSGEPLEESGFLNIETGDRVKVDATMGDTFFSEGTVVANTLIQMSDVSES
ncbi:NirD/YgiW/YdeI family stress tolerance protein [Alteromonas ponticola]|uniref:NirD/YgiW/YdeI family stress tolerance protein n=1 Tax=Alteromonas ponticola TaxID=2720613 RepID=A0ABX1R1D7_9ALTE|nr:NirD/YgiW/YdeI family stress tolerance protein [Alteromonas ponticola]NMH60272.1 NirD/YgiW/YdeI family stress tolerance protein [Alteromonas ponticola]